ncbi:GNAT family N-acetyltransferase [Actinokineospora inagensis]|uniref:GNAT family N-acetyltransferase n=1 Tax=Actinokineospora inagensis TaxID=103730 RepID=UPI001B7FEA51|nr:GNAT family N-acetyltransferase [Actinokineospora inagensis]
MQITLRLGTTADTDAVGALHARCSAQTLFTRYHAGLGKIPPRWLTRLLQPPNGTTVVAACGSEVVAIAQLIPTGRAEAEVAVLVEDGWQRRGLGTALIRRLAADARATGHQRLIAWCLPAEPGFVRAAAASGLPVTARHEDDLLRVALGVRGR